MYRIEHFQVIIPYTGLQRRVSVYLPSGYDETQGAYPVLYMHDGQNLFNPEESYYGKVWDVHTSIERMIEEGISDGVIVVGIDNPASDNEEGIVGRLDEYSPWVNKEIKKMLLSHRITRDVGGYGDKYAKFLVEDLKPMIDKRYRTLRDREHTGVAGSSMGGLISLYIGLEYEDVFSKVAAFSTAVWFAREELLAMIKDHGPDLPIKWYLDVGTAESSNDEIKEFPDIYLKGTLEVYETLLEVGVKEKNTRLVQDQGGRHNEVAWQGRFPQAFQWLFS